MSAPAPGRPLPGAPFGPELRLDVSTSFDQGSDFKEQVMNLIFAGTPAFALPTLQNLHAAGHKVAAVYTQPDRPAGRGRKLTASPVKSYALACGMPVRQPATLRGEEAAIAALRVDVMVVVAYGLILPATVLNLPKHGCINVHASLLPRWRGAAPVARAIEAGDRDTGITIMRLEAGLDTGPMLLQRRTPILDTDTAATLEQRLAAQGAALLATALEHLALGHITAQAQDGAHATYAPKLNKGEASVDWSLPALRLHRKIRALNPWPVAMTLWRGQPLRLWEVGPLASTDGAAGAPGTVIAADAQGLLVQTGDGVLNVQRLQAPGGRALPVREFLNGTPISPGDRLGA